MRVFSIGWARGAPLTRSAELQQCTYLTTVTTDGSRRASQAPGAFAGGELSSTEIRQ